MIPFKNLTVKQYSTPGEKISPDSLPWRNYSTPVLVKDFGPIDYINFGSKEPYYFAITCSARVQLYNPITKVVYRNFNQFKENAYGGTLRPDGSLLCVGGEEPHVKLFDVSSKSLLRVFKGHTSAVHRCCFTCSKTQIASFSNDKSVCVWDVPSEKLVTSFSEHTDYIRAGTVSPISNDIILSGGYDKLIKMYDTRSGSVVLSVDHGAPVESVLFLPSAALFISAGGTEIRVWDALSGGHLLTKMSHHHKTITCIHLASQNRCLLSGSIDKHVKIYDMYSYKLIHTFDLPSPVLSVGISPDDNTLVTGMTDGLISIQVKRTEIITKKIKETEVRRVVKQEYNAVADISVPKLKKNKKNKSKLNNHIRKFEFSKALDCVIKPAFVIRNPAVTVSVFQELIRRNSLKVALAGRDEISLIYILRFLIKYISDHRFSRVLIIVSNYLLDDYEDSYNELPHEVKDLFFMLHKALKKEIHSIEMLLNVQGALKLLTTAASLPQIDFQPSSTNLMPSAAAQSKGVVSLS